MSSTYEKLPRPRLESLAAGGDQAAAAEIKRRTDGGAAAPVAPAPPRRAQRTLSWQRPLTSSRYSWWPPQVGQPSYEMQEQSKAYWRAERERERAALRGRGYVSETTTKLEPES